MKRAVVRTCGIVMTVSATCMILPDILVAATITVNDTADANGTVSNSKCSLREAIMAANMDTTVDGCSPGSGTDTIILPSGTYSLAIPGVNENAAMTGDLDVAGDLVLTGGGADSTIIDGAGLDRVLHIDPSCDGKNLVQITGITFRNGLSTDAAYPADGGGIYNCGNLSIVDSVVADNKLTLIASGGGIYNKGFLFGKGLAVTNNEAYWGGGIGNAGTVILSGARLDSNHAYGSIGSGGGIDNSGEATLVTTAVNNNYAATGGGVRNTWRLRLVNSTVSNNAATHSVGGGVNNEAVFDATNSTISSNTAVTGGAGIANKNLMSLANVTVAHNAATGTGGAVYNYNQGIFEIENSLLANNAAAGAKNNCSAPAGSITSYGYNLEDANSCGLGAVGDTVQVDPLLEPLRDNGGGTLTHAVRQGSPAIDAGNPSGCKAEGGTRSLLNDQRSLLRPVDGDSDGTAACDIGAYEFGAVSGSGSDLRIQVWDLPDPVTVGGNLTYNIVVTNDGPQMAEGIVITELLPPNVAWVSSSVDHGTCIGTRVVTCYIGSLFKADTATPSIVVKTTGAGLISNSVSAASSTPDPSLSNNTASATTLTSGLWPVRRMAGGTTEGSYASLQAALDGASSKDDILAMAVTFNETVIIDRQVPIALKGGYNSTFSARAGDSTIAGKLLVRSGLVSVRNIKLR